MRAIFMPDFTKSGGLSLVDITLMPEDLSPEEGSKEVKLLEDLLKSVKNKEEVTISSSSVKIVISGKNMV